MFLARRIYRPFVLPLSKGIRTSPVLPSEDLVIHHDTIDNNAALHFEFTPENMQRITALINNYPKGYERSALGAVLDLAQRQHGWVPISAMHRIASILRIPKMRVYEFATFYTMYKRRDMGKFHVQVCCTTPCMLCGSDELLERVEYVLGCKAGELNHDRMFGISIVQCQGACANAPVVVINDDYYEDLTPDCIQSILLQLKDGEIPPPGPKNGRYCAEPRNGLTSLTAPPPGPGFMLQNCLENC